MITISWSKMMLEFLQQAQHNLFKEEQEALRGIILQPQMERQDAIIAPGKKFFLNFTEFILKDSQ